jgi:hypothetical protein
MTTEAIVQIPSAELTGTREEKLRQLDAFLSRLYEIRRCLDPGDDVSIVTHPLAGPPARAWWVAGVLLAAALGSLAVWSWEIGTGVASNAGAGVAAVSVATR